MMGNDGNKLDMTDEVRLNPGHIFTILKATLSSIYWQISNWENPNSRSSTFENKVKHNTDHAH